MSIMIMWKLFIVLIFIFSHILPEESVPKMQTPVIISEAKIREKRKKLEEQHHVHYLADKDSYRNWPEANNNPKFICQIFLELYFPEKTNVALVIPEIRKVILNYMQMRNENNNLLTPKRVSAVKCKLHRPLYKRRLVYFIRSPHSPNCALFLNRIGNRSSIYYIVEEICKDIDYPFMGEFMVELEEDKLERFSPIGSRQRRRLLALPREEVKIKHAELEQRHYNHHSNNSGTCNLWPLVSAVRLYDCHRFLSKILGENKDLSSVVASFQLATLYYLEIRGENNTILDPVTVNSIACKLPYLVRNRKNIHFIGAPSYPTCVYYVLRKMLLSEHFYIAEEICDTLNHKTSLYKILLENEQGIKFSRNLAVFANEEPEKLQAYEYNHFHDYATKQTNYRDWPGLEEMHIKSHCLTILENIFPLLAVTYEVDVLTTQAKHVEIQYSSIEKIPLRKVKAFECFLLQRPPPNQFLFIKSTKPNCVFWIKRKRREYIYTIAREFC